MPAGTRRLRLFAGTWNVNGRAPEERLDLSPWLLGQDDDGPCDLYMLGFQEVQVLAGVDAVRTDTNRGVRWRAAVARVLEPLGLFMVTERQLVGILILVFAKLLHKPFLSEVAVTCVGTGFLNTLGNKGAVAARFRLYDRVLSCVACHLAAHDNNIDRRNQDFRDVVRKAIFPSSTLSNAASDFENSDSAVHSTRTFPSDSSPIFPDGPADPSRSPSMLRNNNVYSNMAPTPGHSLQGLGSLMPQNAATGWISSFAAAAAMYMDNVNPNPGSAFIADPNAINILDHDAVFWLGDLNYRIDAPSERVIDWIDNKDWESLRDADQLTRQMRVCPVFRDFYEGPIRFAPTYKLESYEDKYCRDEAGTLKRTPAYTDRILWRKGLPEASPASKPDLELLRYSSARVYSSDHRPVSASFAMKFYDEGAPEVRSRDKSRTGCTTYVLAGASSARRPSVRLSVRTLSFGTVHFEKCSSAKLVVTNDGSIPVSVSISADEFPPWLTLQNAEQFASTLQPGQSISLHFQVLVTAVMGCSAALGSGETSLEAVLYLDLNRGAGPKEKFELKGRYAPTCLGSTLAIMAMRADPMGVKSRSTDRATNYGNEDRDVVASVEHHRRGFSASQVTVSECEREQRAEPGLLPLSVPKEIWWLIDLLWRVRAADLHESPCDDNLIREEECRWINTDSRLFLASGDLTVVEKVQECIDHAHPIPDYIDALAVASCLLRLLRCLEEPVIPFAFYDAFVDAAKRKDTGAISILLTRIPALNANVFRYILNLLLEMPSVRDGTGIQELSEIFGEALMAPNRDRSGRDMRERATFIRLCLRSGNDAIPRMAIVDLARTSLAIEKNRPSHPFSSTSSKSRHPFDSAHEQHSGP